MSKFVGTGPSSFEKRIYRTAVSQRLRNTDIDLHVSYPFEFWRIDVLSCARYWDVIVQVTRLLLECHVMLHGPDGWLLQLDNMASFRARRKQMHAMQQHLK